MAHMLLRKGRVGFIVTVGAIIFSFQGCGGYVTELQPMPESSSITEATPTEDPEVLIGVALSGGGSRAALFGAAGLEELARIPVGQEHKQRSLLNDITHISSVSGGSVAGSYFAMRKPLHKVDVLKEDGTFTEEYESFFRQYKEVMMENYQDAIIWQQILKLRWLNSSARGVSLAEVLADKFLSGRRGDKKSDYTVRELSLRERAGDSPRLLINTTLYNNGRRFVVSTLPQNVFDYNLIEQLSKNLKEHYGSKAMDLPESLQTAQTTLLPLTPQAPEVRVNPDTIVLAEAVAASASVPLLLGPITAQIKGRTGYFHAGDGGLFDNQGTESLAEVFLKKLQQEKSTDRPKRALIIALDSSFPFWDVNQTLTEESNGFKIFLHDPTRISGIMEQRANAYQALLWHTLQTEGIIIPRNLKVIVIRHTDEVWSGTLPDDIRVTCENEKVSVLNAEGKVDGGKVRQRLAQIPTRFELKSDCDKKLLQATAALAVRRKRGEILQFLK